MQWNQGVALFVCLFVCLLVDLHAPFIALHMAGTVRTGMGVTDHGQTIHMVKSTDLCVLRPQDSQRGIISTGNAGPGAISDAILQFSDATLHANSAEFRPQYCARSPIASSPVNPKNSARLEFEPRSPWLGVLGYHQATRPG